VDTVVNKKLISGLFITGIFPCFFNGVVNALVAPLPALFWAWETFMWLVMPAAVFWVAIHKGGVRWSDLGVHMLVGGRRRPITLVILGVIVGALLLLVYALAAKIAYAIISSKPFFAYQSLVPAEGLGRAAVVTYLAVTAGVVEELYFRGFLFKICGFFAPTDRISCPLSISICDSPLGKRDGGSTCNLCGRRSSG